MLVRKLKGDSSHKIRTTGIEYSGCCRGEVDPVDHVLDPPSLAQKWRDKWEAHAQSFSRTTTRYSKLVSDMKDSVIVSCQG